MKGTKIEAVIKDVMEENIKGNYYHSVFLLSEIRVLLKKTKILDEKIDLPFYTETQIKYIESRLSKDYQKMLKILSTGGLYNDDELLWLLTLRIKTQIIGEYISETYGFKQFSFELIDTEFSEIILCNYKSFERAYLQIKKKWKIVDEYIEVICQLYKGRLY